MFATPAFAQTGFGSNPDNYTCEGAVSGTPGSTLPIPRPRYDSTKQKYVCDVDLNRDGIVSSGETADALPLPPSLRQIETWFVAVLYLLWGFAGIFFTVTLIYLGFQYMTSQGDSGKIGDIRKRFQQWFIGFALVFLAYPVLNTVFSVIGINTCLTKDIQLPGFQFFFEQALPDDAC